MTLPTNITGLYEIIKYGVIFLFVIFILVAIMSAFFRRRRVYVDPHGRTIAVAARQPIRADRIGLIIFMAMVSIGMFYIGYTEFHYRTANQLMTLQMGIVIVNGLSLIAHEVISG